MTSKFRIATMFVTVKDKNSYIFCKFVHHLSPCKLQVFSRTDILVTPTVSTL